MSTLQNPASPETKWDIGIPTFDSSRLDLFLKYPVSDFISYDNLGWKLYDGRQCGNGGASDITDNDYLEVAAEFDENTPEGGGTAWRNVTLVFSFDPETIRQSPIITNEGLETNLRFCVRFSAYSAPTINPGAMEIFYKETFLTVDIQQAGNVDVDGYVLTPEDINQEEDTVSYKLRGYLCNETNHEIIDPIPIFQGMLTKVCVTPTDRALADGVYMRAIDSFYWTRETIYQTAITPHQTAAALTEINCEPGMIVCSFATILKGPFFYRLGRVDGAGFGWLQVRLLSCS